MSERVYPENGKVVRSVRRAFALTAFLLLPPLLPTLPAAAQDPVVLGRLVYADPNPTAYGPGPSGEVVIAGTVPIVRLAGSGPTNALVLGIEGAAFAHFSFAVVTRELVNTDWVLAVPLVWHRGAHWLRLRYYHTSSHLGDECQRRFGPSSINFSHDGLDFTAYARPALGPGHTPGLGLGLYAGGLWSLNSHPEEEAISRLRAGLEIDPSQGALLRPFAALDVELEEGSEHGPRWSGQIGIWLPAVQGRPLRIALEGIAGPAAMGQFSHRETRRVAVGLFWNP